MSERQGSRAGAGRLRRCSIEGLAKAYGATVALDGVDLTRRARDDPRPARAQRRGQDLAGLDRRRAAAARRGPGRGVRDRRACARPQRARRLIGLAPQDTGVYLAAVRARQPAVLRRASPGCARREVARASTRSRTRSVSTRCSTAAPSQLSGGERRRLHTAIALLHRPALVLLDEPTTGADVRPARRSSTSCAASPTTGSAVVYSTHYLHEIEELDADVAFIDHGRIVARGRARRARPRSTARARSSSRSTARCPPAARVDGAVVDGTTVRIPAADPAAPRPHDSCPRSAPRPRSLRSIEIVRPEPRVGVPHGHRSALRADAASEPAA